MTRTYTELDKVASSADALGRVTTATYDAAGQLVAAQVKDTASNP
jgi:YD repeat-containing protein